ncbi:MAG TPA: leucyl aminopeptidase [Actinomycetota bacterium]|nr:leucyl aminopeptidase [Actinomycetota bacterium]
MATFERFSTALTGTSADLLVVGVHSGRTLTPAASEVDLVLDGGLAAHLEASAFKGDIGDTSLLPTFGRLRAGELLAVGLGPGPATTDALRRAAGAAARKTGRFPTVALALSGATRRNNSGAANNASTGNASPNHQDEAATLQGVVEGYLLGSYRFDRYKSGPDRRRDERILIAGPATDADLRRGETIANAVNWARDIVNEPAGGRGPDTFAELARQRAGAAGLHAEILDETELARRGMNGILGVGQGSRFPPRLLILRYEPEGAAGFVGAVGKGITFDSGGLSLKPAESMETMKTDCSGAAAVVAAMCALPALGPKIKVVAAAPLAENMPGGGAIKPGDVIRHYGGHTSEVLNTDAEGRLVLADALAWVAEQRPDAMIDFATLTGAMTIALGKKVAGFFATSPELAAEMVQAAGATGERVWQMPFIEELRRQGDSEVADIKNIGTRWGGAIFAALFLREFTGSTPWIHVDIAGPARSEEAEHHIPKGPTGMGTRLLIEWIERRAARQSGQNGS